MCVSALLKLYINQCVTEKQSIKSKSLLHYFIHSALQLSPLPLLILSLCTQLQLLHMMLPHACIFRMILGSRLNPQWLVASFSSYHIVTFNGATIELKRLLYQPNNTSSELSYTLFSQYVISHNIIPCACSLQYKSPSCRY